MYCGIRLSKIIGHGHSRIVVVRILQVGWKCRGSQLRNGDWRLDEGRLSGDMRRGIISGSICRIISVRGIAVAAQSSVIYDC